MGVVQRQGFKYSIINFIGVGIGILSTLFIYPNALEIVGLFRSLFDASALATIIVLLGSPTSAVRFFPKYRDDESSHKGLLTWLLIVYASGFLLFLLFFPFINQLMIRLLFHERNKMFQDFIIYIIPLTFCIGLINLLARYISNFRRIVIPSAFENLTIKITLPIIILMYLKGWLNVEGVVIGIVLSYILATIGLTSYLYKLGHYRLTKPAILYDRVALKEYSKFSWYSLLTGIGSQVAFRIDGLMVAGMIQFQASGLYAVSWAVSDVISKPSRAITSITGPMIAHYLETDNLDEVKTLYKKSSLNMTIIGLGLFLLIWTVLPYMFEVMPNTEVMKGGSYVVFFLGLSQVWDMMTGVNNEIIMYSKYYKFNLYMTLFLAVTNILLNLILITEYGITGAAMATCFSLFLFNVVKFLFIKIKFGFQPFSIMLIPVIAFGIAATFICRWLPDTHQPWIDMFYKGTVFCLVYGLTIWRFKISQDINDWVGKAWGKVFHRPPAS
ncbi:MAG TPA: polysaccharide biosynthesis C-terminal domain-containing protein [Saprospiraceae bacterium]|nr:polysaccharide biosynthesis C-terminal domain-containing protein [Saprospiraceae bacterium]